jgi:uncharacterized protein
MHICCNWFPYRYEIYAIWFVMNNTKFTHAVIINQIPTELIISYANTWLLRARGLLGRPKLSPTEGLLITPCNSIHTFGMKYALDIIYLSKSMRVIKIVENVHPLKINYYFKSHSVLELTAGAARNFNISVDNSLTLTPLKSLNGNTSESIYN